MTVEAAQHDLTADRPDAPIDSPEPARPWLIWAQHAAMLLALVIWGRVVTGRSGGRDDGALVLGCLSLLPAILLLRPALRTLVPLLTLVLAALAVCVLAPFGFASPEVLGTAAYTGAAFAVVRTFASTPDRRLAVATALCLVSLDQFSQGFLAWWGGENPDRPMIGTFFWHNPYAAFLLPGVLLGSALAVFGHSVHRLAGFLSAPVCFAGVVYSTSRASMMLAVAGVLAVLALAAVATDRRQRLPIAAALAAACVAVTLFFTSGLFFSSTGDVPGSGSLGTNPLGATVERGEDQSLGQNAGYRLDFWQAAAASFQDRPLVGGGFGSFRELSGPHLPPAAVRSPSAHNEFLQALAEGGLVWGLPVIGLTAAAAIGAMRRLRGRLLRPAPDRAVAAGGALALLGLVAHAGVDFDWSYPALTVAVGVTAALVLAIPRVNQPTPGPAPARRTAAALAACVALVLAAQVAHAGEATSRSLGLFRIVLERSGPAAAADSLTATQSWYDDPRIDAALLEIGLARGVGEPLALPHPLLTDAVAATEDLATVSDRGNAYRAGVLAGLGRTQEGLRSARHMAEARAHSRPATLQAYAALLAVTGSRSQAVELLAGTVLLRADEARANPGLGVQLYTLYRELSRLAPASVELRCAGSALSPLNLPLQSTAPPLARSTSTDRCARLSEKGWA